MCSVPLFSVLSHVLLRAPSVRAMTYLISFCLIFSHPADVYYAFVSVLSRVLLRTPSVRACLRFFFCH